MKNLLFLLLSFASSFAFSQTYSKVKIYTDASGLQQLSELGLAVDHGEQKPGYFFVSDFSDSDIALLDQYGFAYDIMIPDVKAYYASQSAVLSKNVNCTNANTPVLPETPLNFEMDATYGGFYRYQDMLDALDSMATMYPNLITVKAPISTFLTHENRPIYFVKISDNPSFDDTSEPNALYSAIHHAREPMSMSQTIFYMWYLLENYATNEEVQYIVNNTELFFVPCINPDGYIHNETNDPNGFGMHRKNKAPVGTTNPGVDLNRNYSYAWNTTGVTSNVNGDTYPGSGPFSEPETSAMKWLAENYGFKTAMNAHSYGELLLFPIGASAAEFADHHDYLQDLSNHMTIYNGYSPIKGSSLYSASGASDDYYYREDIGVGTIPKDTVFAMTPETGTAFWPAQSEVIPTCSEMLFSNMTMAHVTHRYLVAKETDNAMITANSGYFHHSVQRLGFEDGAVSVLIEPLLNIQSVGTAVVHDIAWHASDVDSISYTLSPTINFGDEIKYVLVTDYTDWQRRDTITKMYDQWVVVVSDNASSASNWTGDWSLTADDAYSPTTSFTDSDGGNYQDNANTNWTYTTPIDLTQAQNATVNFYAKWTIEADYDYCQFQVSTNNGASWIGQCGIYTVEGEGSQLGGEPLWEGNSNWVQENISLSDYVGNTILMRFVFVSDNGLTYDGFYFDDFKVSIDYTGGLNDEALFPLALAPNPSNDAFILSAPYLLEGSVIVLDQTGKIVLKEAIPSGQKQVSVSTVNIPAGVYYVTTDAAKANSHPAKLVVVH